MGISYRKHQNGKWEYRITYQDPITLKQKEKAKRGFSTKPEARFEAQDMEKKLLGGLEMVTNIPLSNYIREWLVEYKQPHVRKNTLGIHKRNIENHILPYFKEITIHSIKPIMYQKFLNHLESKGYSRRTIEMIHGTISEALEKAVVLRKLEHNPCKGANIPKPIREKTKMEYMESGDIPVFLREAHKYGYIYWIFFKLLLDTGMRKGEAAALTWSDIDLKGGTVTINKTLDFQASPDEDLFGDPKTFTSKRTITIRPRTISHLVFHRNYQNQNKLAFEEQYRHDLNLVLCRNDGSPMPKSSLFNAMERILKRAQLPQIPIHALRDSHAVLLRESGASLEYVQKRLGHKNYQITVDKYSHISNKIEKDTMEQFEHHMGDILG